jgi:hypothetical protein
MADYEISQRFVFFKWHIKISLVMVYWIVQLSIDSLPFCCPDVDVYSRHTLAKVSGFSEIQRNKGYLQRTIPIQLNEQIRYSYLS